MVPDLMRRIYGSDDLFPDSREHAYHAFQSVNYIDCHDGFTLYDLVSYNHKHNWKNGHANQDGMDANYSWNCGHEGDESAPAEVPALRRKQAKNFFCLLMLSNGIPMFRAGDEFLNTQFGNNNPYNQDNEISWLDWSSTPCKSGHIPLLQRHDCVSEISSFPVSQQILARRHLLVRRWPSGRSVARFTEPGVLSAWRVTG